MKAPFIVPVFRICLLMLAMGAAYVLGLSQRVDDEATDTRANTTQAKAQHQQTREELLTEFQSIIAEMDRGVRHGYGYSTRGMTPADIASVIESLMAMPNSMGRHTVLSDLLDTLARSDPATAFKLAVQLKDDNVMPTTATFVLEFTQDRTLAAQEVAALQPGSQRQVLTDSLYSAWARDPAQAAQAAAAALALPPGSDRQIALRAVGQRWAINDPQDALAWASSLGPTGAKTLEATVQAAGEHDPGLAEAYVGNITDMTARGEAIRSLGQTLAENDPAAALDWLNQTATGNTYDDSVKKIMADVSMHNPTNAATLLAKVTEPGVRETAIDTLAKNWAGSDPTAAMAWAQSLPDADGASRNAALRQIVTVWSKKNPTAAADFVQQFPNSSVFQIAAPVAAP